jgi:hypothetical protein
MINTLPPLLNLSSIYIFKQVLIEQEKKTRQFSRDETGEQPDTENIFPAVPL